MIEVTSVEDVKPEYPHWFFYGPTRSGKTRAAATFPRPFFIVPYQEGSHKSLLGRKDIDFVLVHGSSGPEKRVPGSPGKAYSMESVLDFLEDRWKKAEALWQKGTEEADVAAEEAFPWETVVVESVTHYTDLVQEELTNGNRLMMDQQKWGKLSAHLRSMHARLSALPVYVVFVCLSQEYTNSKGDLIGGGPAFPGAMKYKLPSAVEGVVYFEPKPGKPHARYTAYFSKRSVFDAGCRYEALTAKGSMEPFDFAKVQKIIGAD